MAQSQSGLPPGTTIGAHYLIEEKLGEGGMGVVYRARDTRLGRSIALKLLPDGAVGDPASLHRFEQEARTASGLNHPNIVTIHEIGHVGDVHFIAQEFVEGETLRRRVSERRLPVGDALDIAIQVASALEAAHAAGVVHRDIKPENIMLRPDGYAKVLDFGLAKLTQPGSEAEAATTFNVHTKTGVVMGTVRYMSPEQARGLMVDARSDVFSLGAVLYEMVAGRAPFVGPTSPDLLVAILNQDVAPLRRPAPEAPEELERIVAKMLRKKPDERYQGVRDLLVDLKTLKSGAGSVPQSQQVALRGGRTAAAMVVGIVAVLALGFGFRSGVFSRRPELTDKDTILLADFTNTTGEPVFDGGTLKQGLALQLGQTPFLNVFSQEGVLTTLASMERKPDERITGAVAREICQRNGLKAFVSGTIARLGQHYVITIEATDAQSGAAVAISQNEAPDAEHVLQVLSATASGLREKLGETIGTLEKYNVRIDQGTTSSLEALKAASAAQALLEQENGIAAQPLFQRAVELDPNFVFAYDGGAWALAMSGRSREAAAFATEGFRRRERASQLEQLSISATYHHFATGDWEEENRTYDMWTRLFPNQFSPYAGYAINYPVLGRLEDAAEAARTIIRVSPSVAQGYRFLASVAIPLQRFDEAQRAIDQSRARGLDNAFLRVSQLGVAVAQNDAVRVQQALEALRRNEGERFAASWRARLAVSEGRWREARALYQQSQPSDPRATTPAPLSFEALGSQAVFGFCRPAENAGATALSRIIGGGTFSYTPIIATDGALCGEAADADRFADELAKRYPTSTLAREISLPQLRAAAALERNQPERAIEILRSFRAIGTCTAGICSGDAFRTFYMRGQAYLRQGNGAEAVAVFQTILEHRGWSPVSPLYPLAHAGRARGLRLTGDLAGARKAYEDFFSIWKNADADLPVLVEARRDYANLR